MTKRTVVNQDLTVCTSGTGDFAVATKPDICFVDQAQTKQKPFNNDVSTEKLVGGTSDATTIAGKSIWTQPAKVGPPSNHPESPPPITGVTSKQPAFGEAEAMTASTSLYAEEHPVVRVSDKTWQNRRNTSGEVMTYPRRMKLDAEGGGEAGGGGRVHGTHGGSHRPGTRRGGDPNSRLPPSGTEPVPKCWPIAVEASCQHFGRISSPEGRIQIVPDARGDHVTLRAAVNGPCGAEHPLWTGDRGGALPPGRESVILVPRPAPKPITLGPEGLEKIEHRRPETYIVHCAGCVDRGHTLVIEAFDPGTRHFIVPRGKLLWKTLVLLNIGVQLAIDEVEDLATPQDNLPIVDAFAGAVLGEVQVAEFHDHRVYVKGRLALSFDPLVRIAFQFDPIAFIVGKVSKLGYFMRRLSRKVEEKVVPWARKQLDDLKEKAIEHVEEAMEGAGDWLREHLGGKSQPEPPESRQNRALSLFEEEMRKWRERLSDLLPDVSSDAGVNGEVVVQLGIDALVQTPSPDVTEPVVSGAGVTIRLAMALHGHAKGRLGFPMFKKPCEHELFMKGDDTGHTTVYATRAWKVGFRGTTLTAKVDFKWKLRIGTVDLIDVDPPQLEMKTTFPDVELPLTLVAAAAAAAV